MIGKGKSILHISNAINYAKNKIKAQEIDRNLVVGKNGIEIAKEFRIFQNLNSRCIRNAFSFVLSPSIEDGNKLTQNEFKSIAQDFLTKLKLKDHQFITFLHQDKEHSHLHIFVNRINSLGTAYKDNFIGKKAQRAAESIAQELKLTSAKQLQLVNEEKLRSDIYMAHEQVMSQKPNNIFNYAEMIRIRGIELLLKQAANGKVVGLTYQMGRKKMKASAVHRSLSAANLQKSIQKNRNINNSYRLKI